MPFITLNEIIAIIAMAFAMGFIFTRYFRRQPTEGYDPIKYYQKAGLWEDIKYGAKIAAPAIILHELAHKFVAMGFGAQATLHAPYGLYAIVILLSLINFPVLFFVGGYVSHTMLLPLPSAIVSISGPLINLILWLTFRASIKHKIVNRKNYRDIHMMARLNMFLFIFNMLPIPGFDGYHFFAGLLPLIL